MCLLMQKKKNKPILKDSDFQVQQPFGKGLLNEGNLKTGSLCYRNLYLSFTLDSNSAEHIYLEIQGFGASSERRNMFWVRFIWMRTKDCHRFHRCPPFSSLTLYSRYVFAAFKMGGCQNIPKFAYSHPPPLRSSNSSLPGNRDPLSPMIQLGL